MEGGSNCVEDSRTVGLQRLLECRLDPLPPDQRTRAQRPPHEDRPAVHNRERVARG